MTPPIQACSGSQSKGTERMTEDVNNVNGMAAPAWGAGGLPGEITIVGDAKCPPENN